LTRLFINLVAHSRIKVKFYLWFLGGALTNEQISLNLANNNFIIPIMPNNSRINYQWKLNYDLRINIV